MKEALEHDAGQIRAALADRPEGLTVPAICDRGFHVHRARAALALLIGRGEVVEAPTFYCGPRGGRAPMAYRLATRTA